MKNHILNALLILSVLFLSSCARGERIAAEIYTLKDNSYNAVAADMLVDVYKEASLNSARITQALYNQPVKIIGEKNDFYKVETTSGTEGFLLKSKVIIDISSLMTNEKDEKILITGETKTIYAKPDGKKPVGKALTGTVLSYHGKSGDWVRILLCDGREGYLTINNIILYQGNIPETDTGSFLRDVRTNIGSKYLKGGASAAEGFDMPNLIYICAKINGVKIPPDIEDMIEAGTAVGKEEIAAGDVIFLSKDRYNKEVDEVAVVLGNDAIAVFSKEEIVIKIARMTEIDAHNRIMKAIRLFGGDG